MHSNVAVRIYIPDAVFFNSHRLYISQVILIFFSVVIVARFAVIGHGFTHKCSKIDTFLFEDITPLISYFFPFFFH